MLVMVEEAGWGGAIDGFGWNGIGAEVVMPSPLDETIAAGGIFEIPFLLKAIAEGLSP